MARSEHGLEEALERWRDKGLLSAEQVEVLRAEARDEHTRRTRARGRLWVSAVGAAAAFGAAVLVATEAWPGLSEAGRAVLLAAGALVAYGAGVAARALPRLAVAGDLLRVTGMALGLSAVAYSPQAWPAGTGGSRPWGLGALAAAGGAAMVTWRAPTRTALGHMVFVLPFVAAFALLALGLEVDPTVWILDGVWAVGLALLTVRALDDRATGARRRLLPVVVTGAWLGFVLMVWTTGAVLDLGEHAIWPLDAWIVTLAAVTAWAASRARSDWEATFLERHVALCIPVATAMAVFSVGEALEWPAEAWLVAGALTAAAGMAWSLRAGSGLGLGNGAAALVVTLWIYTVERADAVVAAVALAVTALVFFWVGSRIRDT
jgi:hypothetical protein